MAIWVELSKRQEVLYLICHVLVVWFGYLYTRLISRWVLLDLWPQKAYRVWYRIQMYRKCYQGSKNHIIASKFCYLNCHKCYELDLQSRCLDALCLLRQIIDQILVMPSYYLNLTIFQSVYPIQDIHFLLEFSLVQYSYLNYAFYLN